MGWLAGRFVFLDVQLQNWMLVAAAIVALWIVFLWLRRSRSDGD